LYSESRIGVYTENKDPEVIIKRAITPKLLDLAQQFPAVAIVGPRQSGKTT